MSAAPTVYLLRHGETAWSLSGQHTGVTDIPLTAHGEQEARESGRRLVAIHFEKILVSPRTRARRTVELAGLGARAEVVDDLHEWAYGAYEGLLMREIRALQPDWDIFAHGCPGGETPQQVSDRADRVLARARAAGGNVLLVSHGHFTRALAARWVGLPIARGHIFDSATASISILGVDKNGVDVIRLWNWA